MEPVEVLIHLDESADSPWVVTVDVETTIGALVLRAMNHFALKHEHGLVRGHSLLAADALVHDVRQGEGSLVVHLYPMISVYVVAPGDPNAQLLATVVWLRDQVWYDVLMALLPLLEAVDMNVEHASVGTSGPAVEQAPLLHLNDAWPCHARALRSHGYRLQLQLHDSLVEATMAYVNVTNGTPYHLTVQPCWNGDVNEGCTVAPGRVIHLHVPPSTHAPGEGARLRVEVQRDAQPASVAELSLHGIVDPVEALDDEEHAATAWVASDDAMLLPLQPSPSPSPSQPPMPTDADPAPSVVELVPYSQAQGRQIGAAWSHALEPDGEARYGGGDDQEGSAADAMERLLASDDLGSLFFALDKEVPDEASYGEGARPNERVWRNDATTELHAEETSWLKQRAPVCRRSLIQLLEGDPACAEAVRLLRSCEDKGDMVATPILGLAASGGGIRAMLTASAALDGLARHHVLSAIAYVAALSGSTWCIGPWMCHEGNVHHAVEATDDPWLHPNHGANAQRWAKCTRAGSRTMLHRAKSKGGRALGLYILRRLKLWLLRSKSGLRERPFSLVDVYSLFLTDFLLSHHFDGDDAALVSFATLNNRLTSLERAHVPIPILTAVTDEAQAALDALPDVVTSKHRRYRWVSITPWEAACGAEAIQTRSLGQRLNQRGRVVDGESVEELAYLMAVCGSAFAADWQSVEACFARYRCEGNLLIRSALKLLDRLVPDRMKKATHTMGTCLATALNPFARRKQRTRRHVSPMAAHVGRFVDLHLHDDDDQDARHAWTPLRDAGIDFNLPIPALSPCSGRLVDFIICVDASGGAKKPSALRKAVTKGYIAVRKRDRHLLKETVDASNFWCALRPPPEQENMPYLFYILGSTEQGTMQFNYTSDQVDELCDLVLDRFNDANMLQALRLHIAECVVAKAQLLRKRHKEEKKREAEVAQSIGNQGPCMQDIFEPNEPIASSLQKLSKLYCNVSVRPAAAARKDHRAPVVTDVETFVAPTLRYAACMRDGAWSDKYQKLKLADLWKRKLGPERKLVQRVVLQCDEPGAGGTALAHAMGSDPPPSWVGKRFDACVTVRLADLNRVLQRPANERAKWGNTDDDTYMLRAILHVLGMPATGTHMDMVVRSFVTDELGGRVLWILDGLHEVEGCATSELEPWLRASLEGGATGAPLAHAPWLCNVLFITRRMRQAAVPPPETLHTLHVTINDWSMRQGRAYVKRRFVNRIPSSSKESVKLCRSNVLQFMTSTNHTLRNTPLHWHLVCLLVESGSMRVLEAVVDRHSLFAAVGRVARKRVQWRPGERRLGADEWYAQLGDLAASIRHPSQSQEATSAAIPCWIVPDGRTFVHSAWRDFYMAQHLVAATEGDFGRALRRGFGQQEQTTSGSVVTTTTVVSQLSPHDVEAMKWLTTALLSHESYARLECLWAFLLDQTLQQWKRCKKMFPKHSAVLESWRQREHVRHLCSGNVLCAVLAESVGTEVQARLQTLFVDKVVGRLSNSAPRILRSLRKSEIWSPYRLEICLVEGFALHGCVALVTYLTERHTQEAVRHIAVNAAKYGQQKAVLQALGEVVEEPFAAE